VRPYHGCASNLERYFRGLVCLSLERLLVYRNDFLYVSFSVPSTYTSLNFKVPLPPEFSKPAGISNLIVFEDVSVIDFKK
jgi:hypothetical protein